MLNDNSKLDELLYKYKSVFKKDVPQAIIEEFNNREYVKLDTEYHYSWIKSFDE